MKGREHFEDLSVDGRVILEWILGEIRWAVGMAQDRDQCRGPMNTVMNLQVP
jgi:hypothetical protein